ncbi:ABC transporter permease [Mesorhizobium sp. 113-3-3]|uniref:ABC transporter permease n=1 Tax=Mesorhizobium sp. 113-3-3 TaxID=2744516 RepID=UPI0019373A50|nr:ABC transporter permease [Mesorhizobium sp. 113-3-3]BCG82163.1 ABC transporter permease [Mesorhizobium sp. 113-3-3]
MKPAPATIIFLGLVTGLILTMLFLPILMAIATAFIPIRGGVFQWDQASIEAFRSINSEILDALRLTLVVGIVASTIALAISTGLALYCAPSTGFGRKFIEFLIFLPFVMPPIITGLSLLIFFRETDVPRSLLTVLTGHVVILLAIAYRTIVTRLREMGASLVEASLDLGASRLQTFWWVVLPNLKPALLASFVLCFALSFDETIVTLLLTGGQNTFPVRLWGMMRLGFSPSISALVVYILAVSTILAYFLIRLFAPAASRAPA